MRDRFTYPTLAEEEQRDRDDARDAVALGTLGAYAVVLAGTLAQIREIPDVLHPDVRWSRADLEGALCDHLADIAAAVKCISDG